jgi:hypothetical protein
MIARPDHRLFIQDFQNVRAALVFPAFQIVIMDIGRQIGGAAIAAPFANAVGWMVVHSVLFRVKILRILTTDGRFFRN